MSIFENYLQRAIDALEAGGGGGSSALLQIGGPSAPVQLADGVVYIVAWNSNLFGSGVYESRGSDLSWVIGTPTLITVQTTGFYDITFLGFCSAGSNPSLIQAGLKINGSLDLKSAVLSTIGVVDASPGGTCGFTVNSRALTAGDTLSVQINQTNNVADDTPLEFGVINIARRA